MLASPWTRGRRRGRVPTRMSSETGDEGGTVESLTGQRRPREHGEDDDGDEQSQTEHCALVGVRRQVSVRGFTERERGPGGRRRRGKTLGHAHAREADERRSCRRTNGHWTRSWHAKMVVTACTGAHSATSDAKPCLGVSPSWVGCNYGGNLVKQATVKRLVSSEVYCYKLYQLNVINRELLCLKCYAWGV